MRKRKKSFWTPWLDDKDILKLTSILAMVFILLVTALYINLQDYPKEQTIMNIYSVLLLWTVILWLMDWASTKKSTFDLMDYVGFGTKERAIKSMIAGVLATVVIFNLLSISTPSLATSALCLTIGGISLGFLFQVIFVPYVEEKFFAGVLAPGAIRIVGVKGGLLVTVISFMVFHGFIYSWNQSLLIVAGVWRLGTLLGNYYFRSTGFSLAAHIMNNYLKYIPC